MARMRSAQRVLGSTRGEILGLLCNGPRTVNDVSHLLNLTPNGVRTHLAALEADGLVTMTRTKQRVGKPAHVFKLTPAGHSILSAAYLPVLKCVLEELAERDSNVLKEVLPAAGRRMAAAYPKPSGTVSVRAEKSVGVLRDLGSVANVEEDGNARVITGVCCPIGDVVPGHPEACKLIEAMLSELIGEPVKEFCHKTEPLRCQFRLRLSESAGEKKRRGPKL